SPFQGDSRAAARERVRRMMGAGGRSTRGRARARCGIGARGPPRSARITNANWHADDLEAQLARTRADHLPQLAGLALSGTDGVGTLAFFSTWWRISARPRLGGHHVKVAVGGDGPQSPRRFGAPPDLQAINLPSAPGAAGDQPRSVAATGGRAVKGARTAPAPARSV